MNFELNLFTHNNEGEDETKHTTEHRLKTSNSSIASKLSGAGPNHIQDVLDKIKNHFHSGDEKSLLNCIKQLDNLTK